MRVRALLAGGIGTRAIALALKVIGQRADGAVGPDSVVVIPFLSAAGSNFVLKSVWESSCPRM
jgi:hypothetical protein